MMKSKKYQINSKLIYIFKGFFPSTLGKASNKYKIYLISSWRITSPIPRLHIMIENSPEQESQAKTRMKV